jgi:hypothetical protein
VAATPARLKRSPSPSSRCLRRPPAYDTPMREFGARWS